MKSRAVVMVAAAWMLLHVVVPLRHIAYPGDVLWNEDGMAAGMHRSGLGGFAHDALEIPGFWTGYDVAPGADLAVRLVELF